MRPILMMSIVLAASLAAAAAELDSATIAAWNQYSQGAQARALERATPGRKFLWIDESPATLAKVQAGELAISPMSAQSPKKAPSGLIHHWVGGVFIPNATLKDVVTVVRDYPRYKDYFPQNVLDSRVVEVGETTDRSSLVLKSQSFFVRSSLDADYESRYVKLDRHSMYSITHTTRIQEVEGYGGPDARTLPVGMGTGAIWRLMNINRYVERDGGVYVEIEAIVLSRDIPMSVRWAVEPIVRRVSRSSMALSLRQTESAVARRAGFASGH